MSTFCVSWALNNVRCAAVDKVILIAIAERCDDFGNADKEIYQIDIAEKADISVRSVQRRLKNLQAVGVVEIFTKQLAREKRVNTYKLNIEQVFDLTGKEKIGDNLSPIVEKGVDNSGPVEGEGDKLSPILEEIGDTAVSCISEINTTNCRLSQEIGDTAVSCIPKINTTNCRVSPEIGDKLSCISEDRRQSSVAYIEEIGDTAVSYGNNYLQYNTNTNTTQSSSMVDMAIDWFPSKSILNSIKDQDPGYIEFCLGTFRAYWLSHPKRRQSQGRFDSHFLKHLEVNRSKWDAAPKPMTSDWNPDPQVVEQLSGDGVPLGFIDEILPEFRMYWIDRKSVRPSWNKVFLKHAEKQYQFRQGDLSHVSN